ncbi:MAG TPA: hypothetical protein VGC37_06095 [Friedmanniella sp.]
MPSSRRALAAVLLACGLAGAPVTTAVAAPAAGVTFTDAAFRQCVSSALNQAPSAPITPAQAASLTSLVCDYPAVGALGGVASLTNLVSLDLGGSTRVSDLSPLAGMTRLRTLVAPNGRIRDLAPLQRLTGLTRLEVGNNPVRSLWPLTSLTRLTTLYVDGATWTTLLPLRPLTGLQKLSVSQDGTVDIGPLAALTKLWYLNLSVPDVTDLSSLRSLTGLTQLNLHAGAADLAPLGPLTRLQTLSVDVADGSRGGAAALTGKPALVELSATGLPLTSLAPVASSTRLTTLFLVSKGLRDVSALKAMPRLGTVVLSGVDRADLSPLSRLPALDFLSIDDSRLGPLSQLRGFPALTSLELTNDGLSSLDGFVVPAELSSLSVSGNHLGDLRTLSCDLLVNALGQTVPAPKAVVGHAYRLSLAGAPSQTVRLAASSSWTSSGTSVTYREAGTFRVPFTADGPDDCSGVSFDGVVVQTAGASQLLPGPRHL